MKIKALVLALVCAVASISAYGFDTIPLQIGLWPNRFQMVPPEINVAGLKLNILYGANQNVTGLDLGFISSSDNTSALQANVFLNMVEDTFHGIEVGLVNLTGDVAGLQVGAINVTDRSTSGVQVGIVNSTIEMNGVQVGLVNYTQFMVGLQVGLANIITESMVPVCPIINFCF